ncbi:hypothetical protein CSUI_006615 [Cystoisospora suis]|uniref:Transmembrane protein n=1 Tax=Cystoisospora suis TaxID=483139 RepID=A0A2C6KTH8_9APIC|nr:hypothetical protein CSUI_006615 [Cystoisospora suis]
MGLSVVLFVMFFALASKTSSAQDIDLAELFGSGASPTGMLFDLLGEGDNFRMRDVLKLIPGGMQTQSEELKGSSGSVDEIPSFDCNLTGIDPACFLIEFASRVGASWKTQEVDAEKAADLVARFLQPHGLTTSAAVAICVVSPAAIPFLVDNENGPASTGDVINGAKTACMKST